MPVSTLRNTAGEETVVPGSNRSIIVALAAAIVAGGAVLVPVRGDDEGLPLPGDPAMAPFAPAPSTRPDVTDGFDLQGAWRITGRDATRGPFDGEISFERAGRRYFRYVRRVRFEDGAREAERGEAAIHEGRLMLRQAREPEAEAGLRHVFTGPAAAAAMPQRRAVLRLCSDGRRFDGEYRFTSSSRAGAERLEPTGDAATNNDVRLMVDGHEMFPALREALCKAKRSIVMQTFIYTDDSTGRAIGRLLMERAQQGVVVRLLVDNVGNKLGKLEDELRRGGVEVVIQHGWGEGFKESVLDFGRGIWDGIKRLFGKKPKPRERRGLLNHDHRKITVVDGRIGFTGGMNIAREYENDWHDVHASVEGSAVERLEEMFYDRWKKAGGEGARVAPADDLPSWPGSMAVDVLGTVPGLGSPIKDRYLAEIRAARDRVLIENAYFLDDDVIDAMQASARSRVRNVLILPPDQGHDVPVVRDAFTWVQNDVVRSGVEVYKYRGRMVHSKVAAFDGRVATVGSSNLDPMALGKLAEVNLFVVDQGFTRTLEQRVFARDIPASDREVEKKLGWWDKVKGGVLHFFRGVL